MSTLKRLNEFWKEDSNNKRCVVMIICFQILLWGSIFSPVKASEFDVKSFLNDIHVRVGTAYKIQEDNALVHGVPIRKALTARLGVWYRFNGVLTGNDHIDFGVDHHSQYSEGAPFNDRSEYAKTEVFIDYTFTIGGLL